MSREMKDSGVEWIGEIPENWDVLPIKRNYRIVAGATPKSDKPENWDGEIPWITPSDYKTEDKYILSGKKSITEKGYNSCSTTMVPANSIIFSKRAPVGTVAISANELCTNQGCLSCVPLNKSNSVFGYYSMIAGKNAFEMAALGTTFMEISADAFANMKLPYCGITEQQQIVHFLDRKCTAIDTAIEKTKKSIEKLEEYKKAVITKAVTKGIDPNARMKNSGVKWIGEIPEGWKVTKTKYLFRILKRIAGREGFDVISITQKGLKIKDITSNEGQVAENYSNYQFVFPGDFAMNHMDLLTGWVDLSALTGVTSPDYRVFHKINESVNDDYYKYVFQSLYFNKVYYGLAQGVAEVGRKRLQAPAFKELKLPCPPADEPAKIAAYIKNKCMAIDALIKKKQTAINKWEEYKKSLIYYAVTGKIDCRNEVIE